MKKCFDAGWRVHFVAGMIASVLHLWLASASAFAQVVREADRVHFLLAVDYPYARAAESLGLDLDGYNMKKAIQDAMRANGFTEGPDGKYTITVLDGRNLSEKLVLEHYRRLKIGENETLVFYYTGHGGFDPEKGHMLAMRNFYKLDKGNEVQQHSRVDRKELLVAMARHHPRAMVVLTDCCSTGGVQFLPGEEVVVPDPAFNKRLKGAGKGEVFRDLFFRGQGVINITAARTGTSATGQREKGGSSFTLALTALLRENRAFFQKDSDQPISWPEAFAPLKTLTELNSLQTRIDPAGGKSYSFHTPEAFALGEPVLKAKGIVPKGGKPPVLEAEATLTNKDASYKKGKDLYYLKNYPVKMLKERAYLISLHSSQFDTFLFVKDRANGKTLAFNHDYGYTSTRSRILFFPPETAEYDVGVSSDDAEATGDFSLVVEESTFENRLAATDAKDTYCLGAFAKRHPIQLKALRSYSIRLESEDTRKLDPFLRIVDEFGNTVAFNDDEDTALGRLNSLVTFRTVSSGTFYIVATSYRPGQTGRYAVFVQD